MGIQSGDTGVVLAVKTATNNYQPNLVTESIQTFSALEKNIVVSVINQLTTLHFEKVPIKKENIYFVIPYSDLSKSRNYDEVGRAAESLMMKKQGFAYINEKGERYYHWLLPFPEIENFKEGGKMYLKIWMYANVVPYYREMGNKFTVYDFEVMRSLGSFYAKRLYEIICEHYRTDTFDYEVDELMLMLNVPPSFKYFDFTRRCLDVANSEIKAKTGQGFTYAPLKKTGKRVMKLRFTKLSPQAQVRQELDKTRQLLNEMPFGEAQSYFWNIVHNYKYGLSDAQKDAVVNDSDKLYDFLRIHSEIQSGYRTDVENPTAYLISSCKVEKVKKPKRIVPKRGASRPVASEKTLASIMGTLPLFMNNSDQ